MSSKIFEGNVSIFENTLGQLALKKDKDGAWNSEHAVALWAKMQELAKKNKLEYYKWSFFKADGGTDPVLMADRYGNPRLTLLPPKGDGTSPTKKLKKLA